MANFLEEITKVNSVSDEDRFPFTLPVFRSDFSVKLDRPVTFLVGENGSGKSTFLETIAAGAKLPTVGSLDMELDRSLQPAIDFAKNLSFRWKEKTHRGFFLRAEDFLGFAKRLDKEIRQLDVEAQEVRDSIKGSGQSLALGTILGQRDQLIARYGRNLDANSHGESFLKFFESRLVPGGLYLLDEPETPLSPRNILLLIAMVIDLVNKDCQFIIATHSPMLMAIKPSRILYFEDDTISEIEYDDVDHVELTRSFLKNPDRYLRHFS